MLSVTDVPSAALLLKQIIMCLSRKEREACCDMKRP